MHRRQLGKTDLQLTTVGFGAWAIGGGDWSYGWGPQDDADSIAAIHCALDLGINWIDTAAVYGLGHSEEIVGKAIKQRSGERPIIATKCSMCWREDRSIYSCMTADSITREVEASLRRLQVDAIDLYQIHWPIPSEQIEEGWQAMARLVEQGKIRHAGVSNFSVAQMQLAQSLSPIASLQPPYSMIDRSVEAETLPFCQQQGIGVVAYSPLQSGLLSGAFDAQRVAALDAGDWRKNNACFREPIFSRALELVRRLAEVASESGHTVSQLAIAWVLRRPEVTSAIVGARRPAQIEETAAAGDWELTAAQRAQVDDIVAEVAVPQPRSLR